MPTGGGVQKGVTRMKKYTSGLKPLSTKSFLYNFARSYESMYLGTRVEQGRALGIGPWEKGAGSVRWAYGGVGLPPRESGVAE